jgi:hypothetical protein
VEFHVPQGPAAHGAWILYTRLLMPAIGWAVSRAWRHTGRFLGRSISTLYETYPLPEQVRMWQAAGVHHVRSRVMSVGGGIVIWGVKGEPPGGE